MGIPPTNNVRYEYNTDGRNNLPAYSLPRKCHEREAGFETIVLSLGKKRRRRMNERRTKTLNRPNIMTPSIPPSHLAHEKPAPFRPLEASLARMILHTGVGEGAVSACVCLENGRKGGQIVGYGLEGSRRVSLVSSVGCAR